MKKSLRISLHTCSARCEYQEVQGGARRTERARACYRSDKEQWQGSLWVQRRCSFLSLLADAEPASPTQGVAAFRVARRRTLLFFRAASSLLWGLGGAGLIAG
jgi:hypothetical protein